ncbi:MAG: transglycosylase SLT domain-containing protein [Bacteroidia bacterium]|nr:transglycosylase SLT domain-containing protein [Methylotenera sp.]
MRVIKNLLCAGLIAIAVLNSNLSYAESNVAGEEITIFADDTFKPAPKDIGAKDLGAKDIGARESTSKDLNSDLLNGIKPNDRNTGTNLNRGRLGDSLDNQIHSTDQAENIEQQDLVIISNDDLWQRIKDGYAMPDSTSPLVANHESWYSSRPDYVRRMVERSQKYLFHIVEEVEKRGMPTEIALLPMIESAYNPQAYSSGRASGIWQFIPSTGKNFGLKQNWWVDNRRNVTFATDAALTYLEKLHTMFGAWDLALAAYNAGEGTVGRAIERNRKLGLPTDYESLNLPPETKNYVPKLQAIKNLMTNPGNYGLKIQTIANTAYFAKVTAPPQIDAHLAAKLAEITDDEFLALNPSYNRPVITSSGGKHELLLPITSAQTFRNNLASYNKPLVSWQTYFAKRGERMENIATKFGIQVGVLRDVNNLPAQKKIKNSSTILVPNGNRADFNSPKTNANKDLALSTTNEPNDNYSAKQDSDNIDLNSAQNNVASSLTNSKDEIEPAKPKSVTYKVKKGENMQIIAKRFGVTVKQIMKTNSLKNSRVKLGQSLTITKETDASAQSEAQTKTKQSNKKLNIKNPVTKKMNPHSKTSVKQVKTKRKPSTAKSAQKK